MEGPSGADVLVDGLYLAVAIREVVVPLIVRCYSRGKRPHVRVGKCYSTRLRDAKSACRRT
jgi:hypothetical protein